MEQYKIRKDGFKEIRNKTLVRTIPLVLIATIAGLYISSVNTEHIATEINVVPYVLPIMVIAISIGVYIGINKQKAMLESYTLSFSNNLITREQINTRQVSIYFNEVKEIIKAKNGAFMIKGKDPTDLIIVFPQIDNYAQLETTLQQIQPITTKLSGSFIEKYPFLVTAVSIGSLLCVYTVSNKIVVAVSGVLSICMLLWSGYQMRKSKNIEEKTKRLAWFVLLIVGSIIVTMINKLTDMKI